MKLVKFLIIFIFYINQAISDGSQSQEHPPESPPEPIPPPSTNHENSHTTYFDPENCEIRPAPSIEELNEYFGWMDDHSKSWSNKDERMCKLVRVIYNMRNIKAHNERFKEGKETFERHLWAGSEFTFEEKLKEFVGELPKDFVWRAAPAPLPDLPPAAYSVDYVKKGLVSPPSPQGGCGSCYAWSAITPLEAQVRKCGISQEPLSVQSMVDCCTLGCWGCSSGWPHWAYKWMMSTGIMTNASYPYVSGQSNAAGICSFNRSSIIARVDSYNKYDFKSTNGNASFIMQLVSAYGPVSATICVEDTLFSYSSGVYRSKNPCVTQMHGVAIVGYGKDPVQGDYWIIKNTWGPTWGNGGYFHITRGTNDCLVEQLVSIPFVRKLDGTMCP